MKNPVQYLHSAIVSGLIAVMVFTQTAIAQDPSQQAQQAAQQAMQASHEAAQEPAQQQPPAAVERQNPTTPSNAPLTPEEQARQRLLSARTLYLARATQDANFPTSPDDAFNLVLAKLRNWGRFQIVDSIAQADLVLQLRDAVHASVVDDINNMPTTYFSPSFQITVADPSTLSPIWTLSSSIPTAARHKNQDALVSAAAVNVVAQLKLLAGDQLTSQDQAAQKQLAHFYRSRMGLAIGLAAGGAAATVALLFVLKHRAADFCQAHNITPCPGA